VRSLPIPKFTGCQERNRRQRKRGGKINPREVRVLSEEPAHEPLVFSARCSTAPQLMAIKRDNVTWAKVADEDYRKYSFAN
jgi:hypothetical protein